MTNDDPVETGTAFTYDIPPEQSVSEAVIAAVAAAADVDPVPAFAESAEATAELALEPLYSVVDPDALDALFRPTGGGGNGTVTIVSFPYQGHDVTVHSEGRVTVTKTEPPTQCSAD